MRHLPQRYSNRKRNELMALVGVFSLLFTFSCRKNVYPDLPKDNQLVILAEITAGDSLKIPVSKSIQVGSGGIISFEEVISASVLISRSSDGRSWKLRLNTSPDFSGNPASVYTGPQRPHYNTTYNLQVQDPLSGTVTAKTTIPAPVRLSRFDTIANSRYGFPTLKCRFTLTDSPGVNHYYVFETPTHLIPLPHYSHSNTTPDNHPKSPAQSLH